MRLVFIDKRFCIIALHIFTALLAGCTRAGNEKETPMISSTHHLPALSVITFWPTATDIAKEWRSDAYVFEVSVEIQLPNSPASSSNILFTFQSPSEDSKVFVVSCSEEDCNSFEVEDYGRDCEPISIDDFKLDSQRVLGIALQHGGSDYVNLQSAFADLTLSRGRPLCTNTVYWTASFLDLATSGIHIGIDANTGEVIELPD
jgi:hypothetical protein